MRPELLLELTTLTPEERQEVKRRISFLEMTSNGTDAVRVEHTHGFIEKHIEANCRTYIHIPENLEYAKTTQRNLVKAAEAIYDLASKLKLNTKSLVGLTARVVACAVLKVRDSKLDMSFNMIVIQIRNAHSLLEWQYPGYVGTDAFQSLLTKTNKYGDNDDHSGADGEEDSSKGNR